MLLYDSRGNLREFDPNCDKWTNEDTRCSKRVASEWHCGREGVIQDRLTGGWYCLKHAEASQTLVS